MTLVPERAAIASDEAMTFEGREADQFGRRELSGSGEQVASGLERISPRFEDGWGVNVAS